jgi:hypothetical protein
MTRISVAFTIGATIGALAMLLGLLVLAAWMARDDTHDVGWAG